MNYETSKRYFNAAAIIGIVIACIALIDRVYSAYLVFTFELIEAETASYLAVGFFIYTAILVMSIKGVNFFNKPLESYDDLDFVKRVKSLKGYSVTYFAMAAYIFLGVMVSLILNEGELDLYAWILNAIMIIAFIAAGTLSSSSKRPIIENINNFLTAKRNAAATESLLYQNINTTDNRLNQNNDTYDNK